MRIILDSNILFSALIKESTTRRLILEYESLFLFPYFIFEELHKHKVELIRKSGLNADEFNKLLQLLLQKVELVHNDVLMKCREEALTIIKGIDQDDVLFIACALAYPDSILWSDDKRLKKQLGVEVLNTSEMMARLNY